MDLSLLVQLSYPQGCAYLPMKQSPSPLCKRPLEFGFDPRFLSDRCYGPVEPL
jgi:hypothetical protein